ncbi:EAL domain-containing protein [Flocculibacter collagenilyticus]|uniref:EAL domain-containing protein n=1 Tax=Flocculibacter collagenilyticus TaxID=2744479 RepID=UPI0018F585A6|nr:EAL domain-containing protein [Flocculibacter collagenilyticus]
MPEPSHQTELHCSQCRKSMALNFDFTMAFQPLVDLARQRIWGYEALVRGVNNESAYSVIQQVNDENRYYFDQQCRVKAIELASKLQIPSFVSINFLPNAVYRPELCIRTTLAAAKEHNFPTERIMFEFTEVEQILDAEHLKNIISYYKEMGFCTATDDFGAGYSGLNLLAEFQTDVIKLDMHLIRNIDKCSTRQKIIKNMMLLSKDLNITILAEGVETAPEVDTLRELGIELMQGYYFAKPIFEQLPEVDFSRF